MKQVILNIRELNTFLHHARLLVLSIRGTHDKHKYGVESPVEVTKAIRGT